MNKKYLWNLLAFMMVAMLSVSFTACSSDDDDEDDGVDTTPISLLAGQNKTIQGADTISTSNRFVAYASKNVVYGWHVGEAALVVNGRKTISITVLPAYHLYDDPVCDWGCDINYVKTNQKQGTFSRKSTDTLLAYEDAGAASTLAYSFENRKLKAVMAVVSTKHSSQYASYLAERYLMLPFYKGEDTYFIGADNIELADANTVVVMQVYSASQLVTMYMPASDYSTRSSQSSFDIENRAKNLLKELPL
ncbi:MAG: hypothetical protein IJ841_03155 [Prevotella sp.]|nr:hypothetical protein [Prevotella sp.]